MSALDDDYVQGQLNRTASGRWSIGDRFEITSGEVLEVRIGHYWIPTRIEHDGEDYFTVVSGIKLYGGMEVRRCR
ncbi:MAG: DUF5348 domain-containing protein [Bdellovibrionota bacterium]